MARRRDDLIAAHYMTPNVPGEGGAPKPPPKTYYRPRKHGRLVPPLLNNQFGAPATRGNQVGLASVNAAKGAGMSRMDDFVATLVAAAQAQAQAGRGPQPNAPQPPTDALIAAARQGGARQGVAAPDPWMAGDAIHGGPDGDMPDWQAAADVFARAAAMRKRRGQPLGGAVLVGQGTRGAGPNALIEAQQGTGQGQQTYQRGNVRYHVYFDEDGKRHVAAFHVGTGRRLN